MDKPGINFTTRPDGDIEAGIHLDTFVKYLSQLLNQHGWANIRIRRNEEPRGKAGYTHRIVMDRK